MRMRVEAVRGGSSGILKLRMLRSGIIFLACKWAGSPPSPERVPGCAHLTPLEGCRCRRRRTKENEEEKKKKRRRKEERKKEEGRRKMEQEWRKTGGSQEGRRKIEEGRKKTRVQEEEGPNAEEEKANKEG